MRVFVTIIDDEEVMEYADEALELAPHEEDAPLFALALHLECGIWSNETAFKKQGRVNVFHTKDLIRLITEE